MIPKTGQKDADLILTFAVVGAILYLVYKFTKVVGAGAGAIEDVITDPFGTEEANSEFVSGIVVDASKLTYPEYIYTAWANTIEIAILGDIDEDEEAVDGVMYQIQNDSDLAELIKAFGVRKDWYFAVLPGQEYTLPAAIRYFLPERVADYNAHFAGWNMTSKI